MPTATTELWELLQRRDMNAAALYLVSQHADEVLGLCRAMVRDEATAEDLSQDVFGRAFSALADFRGEASSRTWILRIARNRCIDHLRLVQRDLHDEEISPEEAAAPEPRVDDLLAARGQVRIGLAALEENERALVMLRFGHGLGYNELAATFGLSEGSTRMRISRAVAKMRQALQPPTLGGAGAVSAPRRSRRRAAQAAPETAASPQAPRATSRAPVSQASNPASTPPPSAAPAFAAPTSPFKSIVSHALRARLSVMAAAAS
ncbi:MAG: RNA polymerase sigma-70 factor (ECF subfamily) [Polyangiales bacterium]|jgi:RNA polymerase sigma-70 factor (ECF subfamily)